MIGRTFGYLTVLRPGNGPVAKRAYWYCVCECGGAKTIMGKYLRSGEVKSCGCLNRQPIDGKRVTHGLTVGGARPPRAYTSWSGMKERCLNADHHKYPIYGGRGIKVCDRWMSFELFYADMGDPPSKHTIDRKDNDGDYEPGNCRWATKLEQGANTRQNRWIEYDGKRLTLSQWARHLEIPISSLHHRLKRGLPLEQALRARIK